MYEYNFKEKRKKLDSILEKRLAENRDKYYFQLNLFKAQNKDSKEYKSIKKKKIILKNNESEDNSSQKECLSFEGISFLKFETYYNMAIGVFELSSYLIYRDYKDIRFEYVIFKDCDFKDVVFEKCQFIGCQFLGCKFENIEFIESIFNDFNNGNISYFENCSFKGSVFERSNLKYSVFKECDIDRIYFSFTNLKKSIIARCKIGSIFFSDCNLKSFGFNRNEVENLAFDDDFLTKLDENTFFDKFITHKAVKNSYNSIYKGYKNIALQFEYNANLNIAGEYHYLYKLCECKVLSGIPKLKSILFWRICGYGEKPTYALITSLEIIIAFAFLYLFTGISVGDKVINYDLSLFFVLTKKAMLVDFIDAFYFSLVTFTTVGYGDIIPIGISVVLSSIEMILGVTMVGIWTATLARKIIR